MGRHPRNFGLDSPAEARFRIWILHCEPWEPRHWHDLPPQAIVLEPAERICFSAAEARDYIAGFNGAPERPRSLWAVRVPVRLRLDRDMTPGTVIRSRPGRRQRPNTCVQ